MSGGLVHLQIRAEGVTCIAKIADWSDAERPTVSYIDVAFVRKFCRSTLMETIQRLFTGSCPKATAMRKEIESVKAAEESRGRRIVEVTCAAS